MTAPSNLTRRVFARETIKPWIMLGPFNQDMSDTVVGLYFENKGSSVPHADFVVYRTPDYTLSGLQDHREGEFESSAHVGQITLGNKANIFWSCPPYLRRRIWAAT